MCLLLQEHIASKSSGEIIDKWMGTFHKSGRAPKLCNKICYSSFSDIVVLVQNIHMYKHI